MHEVNERPWRSLCNGVVIRGRGDARAVTPERVTLWAGGERFCLQPWGLWGRREGDFGVRLQGQLGHSPEIS